MLVHSAGRAPGGCLAVSDTHCPAGTRCPQLLGAIELVERLGLDCLIVLGDMFDDLHRRMQPRGLRKYFLRAVGSALLPGAIYYTTSLSSHDPVFDECFELSLDGSSLLVVPGVLQLEVEGHMLCALHGDAVVRSGVLAYAVNTAASAAGRSLLLEEIAKRRYCSPRAWLLAGHTHIPGLDAKRMLGNPGSWKFYWSFGLRYWRPPSFGAILITRSGVRLLRPSRRETRSGRG